MRRSDRYSDCKMAEIRPERFDIWAKHPTARKILLDPGGRSFDSGAFAEIFSKAEMSGHDLVFVIGGHDGHPEAWQVKLHKPPCPEVLGTATHFSIQAAHRQTAIRQHSR